MRPTILVLTPRSLQDRSLSQQACEALADFAELRWNEHGRALTSEEKRALLPGVEGVITGAPDTGLTFEDLAAADRLRIIGVLGHRVRHVSPEVAIARGITIINAAAAQGLSVAELALGLILGCLRDISLLDRRMRTGEWQESRQITRDLFGRTVGILGLGVIGRRLVHLLAPFHCTVLGYDPYVAPSELAGLPVPVRLTGLDDLLRSAEVLSIHAGITEETRFLLGRRELELLRPGAVLVNTARGKIIDEEALIERLQRGTLTAGLDVYDTEPLPLESPLRRLENVVLTPHAGGLTSDMFARRGLALAQDFRRFFAGEALPHALTLDQIRRHSW